MTEQEFDDLLRTTTAIYVELRRQYPAASSPHLAELAKREALAVIAVIAEVAKP